jgi:hypothetical protein
MGTRRIIYILTLVGSISFYVLYPYWFSWYLLVLLLLLTPFDLIFSLPGMLTRNILLTAPNVLEQGSEGVLVITTLQRKSFPLRCVKLRVRASSDDVVSSRRLRCGAEKGARHEMPIDTSRSGVTAFELKHIWTVSLIGLFAMPIPVKRRATVLIMPTPLKPPHVASLPRGVIFRPKPGGGFAEDYDLRPYHKGDPIRSVHWKISAKLDALIIREPLVPPPHSRLVETLQWNGARERDLILGRLRWISNYLLKWELPYYVRLGDDAPVAEITRADDLMNYIYCVLDSTPQSIPIPASLPASFAWVYRVDVKEDAA